MRLSLDLGLRSIATMGEGIAPNPVTSGMWAEFAADQAGTLTTRVSGADTFVTSWADPLDATRNWANATEAAQPTLITDANGIRCVRSDGTNDILNASTALFDWLSGQENGTLVTVTRQRSAPTTVKRVIGFTVSGGPNQRLTLDNTGTGQRRVQARRQSADAVTTLVTGLVIPTSTQREAVRYRPVDGLIDYIADDLSEVTSSAMPTSGAIVGASQSAAIGGLNNTDFCDVDIYYIALYRAALDAGQLSSIWNWADQRFRVNDPF